MVYSKDALSKAIMSRKAKEILSSGNAFTGRQWNRHVAGYILDDFLDMMKQEDALEFIQYANVLAFIQSGMFDTSARYLETVILPLLTSESLKEKTNLLIHILEESDDVPR